MTAYSIKTKRLLLRCFEFKDAAILKSTIDESKDHLLKWMAWAKHEPEDLNKKIERIRKRRIQFDMDEAYHFAILLKDSERFIGSISLMRRVGADAFEIGYWLHVNFVHNGYITEAASALIKIAFELYNTERIEVHCDEQNLSSAAVPRKLGFNHEATVRSNEKNEDGTRRKNMIWIMFKEDYNKAELEVSGIKAYDELGREIEV